MLADQLTLSDIQEAQVKAILTASAAELRELAELNRNHPDALRTAENDRRQQTDQQIGAVLDDDQRELFHVIREKQRMARADRLGSGQLSEGGTRQLDILREQLALTDEQVMDIIPVMKRADSEIAELRQSSNGDRRAMRSDMQKIMKSMDKDIEALLTDDQKRVYKDIKKEREEEMRNRRPGGRRSGGPAGGRRF